MREKNKKYLSCPANTGRKPLLTKLGLSPEEPSIRPGSAQPKSLISGVRGRCGGDFGLLNRAYDQTVRVLLSSFHVAEGKSILVRLSFCLSPSDVSHSLAEKPNY